LDGELQSKELKTLIWLFEGIEPNEERIEKEIKNMDKEKSGSIDLKQYISFLGLNEKIIGDVKIDVQIRNKFVKVFMISLIKIKLD